MEQFQAVLGSSWGTVTTIVLSTSFITTVLTVGVGWGKDWLNSKRVARYLALRMASLLEAFAHECWKYIDDNQRYYESGLVSQLKVGLPQLPRYPDDPEAWKSLRLPLSEALLAFVNAVAIDRLDLELWEELIEDGDESMISDATDYTDKSCKERGIEALELAGKLRKAYGFSAYRPHDGFDGKLRAS